MLSIIIPAREEERVIARTVLQFTETLSIPHEVIVSDGKSIDSTVDIARKHAHLVVVFEGDRHTAARGRNDGAREAHGDILAFVDVDVTIPNPNEFFEHAITHFNDPYVVGITGPQRALPEIETWGG